MFKPLEIMVVGASFGGIKTAWDLRTALSRLHKITIFSDKHKTIILASFPRVIFEDLPLEELEFDLAKNFNWKRGIDKVLGQLNREARVSEYARLAEKIELSSSDIRLTEAISEMYSRIPKQREWTQLFPTFRTVVRMSTFAPRGRALTKRSSGNSSNLFLVSRRYQMGHKAWWSRY
jgi:hypothetical protein